MQVILSRKGFDSQYGGLASPILPDGRLLPLPIPSSHDHATLGDLDFADVDLSHVLADLSGGRHSLSTRVHMDPDLGSASLPRLPGWRPSLGQSGAAQSHLSRRGIGAGDLFLFFGWFRQTEKINGRWRYARHTQDLHVMFGWLEVGDVLPIVAQREQTLSRYPWTGTHPHVVNPDRYNDVRNTLYIAPPRSTIIKSKMPGGGLFRTMTPALQLTKTGCSRSIWSLPSWFAPAGRPPLSYHPNAASWASEGHSVTLQSAAKGQEFVLDGTDYPQLAAWASSLIMEHA